MNAHKGVRRKSGEPYIYHPLAVAHIGAKEIGLGTTSIICSLLHDVVEDTGHDFAPSTPILIPSQISLVVSRGGTNSFDSMVPFLLCATKTPSSSLHPHKYSMYEFALKG